MADAKVARAVLELVLDDKQYRFALAQTQKETDKTATHVRGISQAIDLAVFREFASVAVGALKTVGSAFATLVERGAQVQNIDSAFSQLTAAIGESRDVMLDTTRSATKGLVADLDLMASSNKALLLGLPVSSESMGTMAQAATTLGRAMGQDAKKSLDDLITALGRSSPLILDNLGLTVKVGEANEAYAAKLGKTVSELTEAEKKTAFYEAAMEAARAKVEEIGGIHLTLRDQVQVAMVAVQNITDALGVAINQSPVLRAGMEALGVSLQGALGANQQQAIGTLTSMVEGLAIGVVKFAQVAVEGARFVSNAWSGLNVMFNAVLANLVGAVGKVASGFALMGELAASLPGMGQPFQDSAVAVRAFADDISHLAMGFRVQAEQAVSSAATTNAVLDTVKTTLVAIGAAMEANVGKAAASAQAVTTALNTLPPATAATAAGVATGTAAIATSYGVLQNNVKLMTSDLATHFDTKHKEMATSAQSAFQVVAQAAANAGFKTRADLQTTALRAMDLYNQMLASGQFTAAELQKAWEAAEAAKQAASETTQDFQLSSMQAVETGSMAILQALGSKFKAAAIAYAIINTYKAISAALASAPWPANLVLAAGAAAQGWAQVNAIRSQQSGFAEGTPGLDFMDFGRVSMQPLHGTEAVIPSGSGHLLAAEIAAAMPGGGTGNPELLEEIRGLRSDLAELPRAIGRAMRANMILATS